MADLNRTVTVAEARAVIHAISPDAMGLIPWARALDAITALGNPDDVSVPKPRHAADTAPEVTHG